MDKQSIALLILNGKGAGNELLRAAVALLRKEGWRLEVRVTWERGDGLRYVNEALSLGVSTVIAGGGDGTLNEIVTALIALPAGKRPVMGILPLGTANDFAISAGIPLAMENALRLALVSKFTAIDVVRVNHSHYFINMATGGFGTRITSETPEKLKMALGGLSYFLHGLIRMDTLKADKCEISGPDFYWQGDALVIGIGNGRQAGGGQLLCPHALINDNQLDLSIVTLQEGVPLLLNTLFGGDDDNPNIIRAKLTSLTLHAPHTMTFNLDGEPLTGTDFHFEVITNAIHCRLPPSCELLA